MGGGHVTPPHLYFESFEKEDMAHVPIEYQSFVLF